MAAQKWRTEDWVAVYLGFFIIAVILAAFSWKLFDLGNLRSTFRWTTDSQIAARAPGWTAALDEISKDAEAKGKDVAAAAGGLKAALQANDRKAIEPRRAAAIPLPARSARRCAATQPRRPARCSAAQTSPRASSSASPGSSSAPSASR
jgi:hypothetical protein